jgi:hypothetical protein
MPIPKEGEENFPHSAYMVKIVFDLEINLIIEH